MSAGVVITRPQAQAAPLAARLAGLGISADVFPLLDIQPLDDSSALEATLARLHDYALVAFVSPNAVSQFFAARHVQNLPSEAPVAQKGVHVLMPREAPVAILLPLEHGKR